MQPASPKNAARTGGRCSANQAVNTRLGPFMDRVRELLASVPVLYAGETPARAAGKLHYVHVACTEFLTAMHTGDRTKQAIDAGDILPGYTGTIVRDGYKGYELDPHRFRRHHPKWHDGLRGENRKWDRLARSTPRNIRTRLWSW